MENNKNELRELSINFSVLVYKKCEKIKGYYNYKNQIIKSSSSIGANLFEAKYAQSRADFINKLEISLKECSETEYWLEVLYRIQLISKQDYNKLSDIRGKIQRMLISSITTAKANSNKR